MARLNVEKSKCSAGLDQIKISGFSDGELSELKSMTNRDAEEKIIEILDDRNNGEGTRYACGYGIYGLWFDNEAAYMSVGTTCD